MQKGACFGFCPDNPLWKTRMHTALNICTSHVCAFAPTPKYTDILNYKKYIMEIYTYAHSNKYKYESCKSIAYTRICTAPYI